MTKAGVSKQLEPEVHLMHLDKCNIDSFEGIELRVEDSMGGQRNSGPVEGRVGQPNENQQLQDLGLSGRRDMGCGNGPTSPVNLVKKVGQKYGVNNFISEREKGFDSPITTFSKEDFQENEVVNIGEDQPLNILNGKDNISI